MTAFGKKNHSIAAPLPFADRNGAKLSSPWRWWSAEVVVNRIEFSRVCCKIGWYEKSLRRPFEMDFATICQNIFGAFNWIYQIYSTERAIENSEISFVKLDFFALRFVIISSCFECFDRYHLDILLTGYLAHWSGA